MNLILAAIWWILPAWIANGVPVIVGGGMPIDFGKKWSDGRRVFGDGKTIKGIAAGIAAGSMIGLLQGRLELGILISTGAVFGDAVASFIKRRLDFKRGQSLLVVDQLDFVAGALLFAAALEFPELPLLVAILILTPMIHVAANFGAYRLGLKKVPW
jgi:CDP-2,3-bis-(O-geranylgeranyl)-sn-glycerol synthase